MNNYNNGFGGYSNGRYFMNPTYPQYQYTPRQLDQPQQQNGLMFNNIRYVNPNEMASYIVLAGNTDMIINKEDKIVQLKSADMVGNSYTRTFKYEEINENAPQQAKQPEIDLDAYVKKEDLKDFIKVDALTQFSQQLDDKFDKLEKKIKIHDILEDKK